MTLANTDILAVNSDNALADTRERAEVLKFFRIAFRFVLGLCIVIFAVDRALGLYLKKSGHRGGISPDIQRAIDNATRHPEQTRILLLGDSVARQMFPHGSEPSVEVRNLTTNAAVTTAGHYYLARSAMDHCPRITDIYILVLPPVWRNNMPRPYTHDYFCGHFHSPGQVWEVFTVKRDIELSFTHLGRCLMPNLMAANSLTQPAAAVLPGALDPNTPAGLPPNDPEHLVTILSNWIGPSSAAIPPAPPGKSAVYLSPTSQYFLDKLKADCRRRGVRLHVYPCPVSSEKLGFEFIDPLGIFDGPIINNVRANHLIDSTHLSKPYVAEMRKRVVEMYHLQVLEHRP